MTTPFRGQQDSKLSEGERTLVARLFSDPTYFPIEFRTWLKNYIESSGIKVTASQITGGTRTRTQLPPGLFISCGSLAAVPPDALACDGAAVSRTLYAQLWGKIGTTWGAGDGTTTFNVPDLRDRAPFGAGTAITPGATDGQAAASRGGARHNHGSHAHLLARDSVSLTPGSTPYSVLAPVTHDVSTDTTLVGPVGLLQDAPNWAGVVYAITTGQSA